MTMDEPGLPALHFVYHELRTQATKYTYVLEREKFAQHIRLFVRIRHSAGSYRYPEISFDDGHGSGYEIALPILETSGMHAHFFITVGWTGEKPDYMGWQELRALSRAGQRIGAHGWTHTLLTHCTPSQLGRELVDSRHCLEDHLGSAVTSMSLPGGRYNRRVLAACQAAGYNQIFSSIPRTEAAPHGSLIGRVNVRASLKLDALEELLQPQSRRLTALEYEYRLKEAGKSLLGDTLYARAWALVNRQEPEVSQA